MSTTSDSTSEQPTTSLDALAQACGVATGYDDGQGEHHEVSASTLRSVLAALGVDAGTSEDDAARAVELIHLRPWRVVLPPTVVTRQGWSPTFAVHVPHGASLQVEVDLEDGTRRSAQQLNVWVNPRTIDGVLTGRATFQLPADLPPGWHQLVAIVDGIDPRHASTAPVARRPRCSPDEGTVADTGTAVATVVVSPQAIALPANLERRRAAGLAVQLYQLRSSRSWGIGDLTDLADLADWSARDLGADYVLVNPMHAAEPYSPVEPSPYLPTSRRFASPLYLRVEDIDEFAYLDPHRQRQIADSAADIRLLNNTDTIDHDRVWDAKLAALKVLFEVEPTGHRAARFAAFIAEEGEGLRRFALWCAIAAHHGPRWSQWPAELRDPESADVQQFAELHARDVHFHQWLQWLIAEQRAHVHRTATEAGMRLGILHDLAVGVHPDGADSWALTRSLARGVSVGAPPDMYNQRGQDWSQPPLRPDSLANEGYAPFRDLVRAALRDAGGVRIDHILGLFRLWWIPNGSAPTEGTYVTYDHEAMLSILVLEATRAGAVVIGEDLGTVAPGVREEMAVRGILGTSIMWFERNSDGTPVPPEKYRRLCMASVTTHDLPPTAGYLEQVHVDIRQELEQLVGDPNTERERVSEELGQFVDELVARDLIAPTGPLVNAPSEKIHEVTSALHLFLAAAPSRLLAVAVADLCADRRPINIPGTSREYPNWSLPLTDADGTLVSLERLRQLPTAKHIFEQLAGDSN